MKNQYVLIFLTMALHNYGMFLIIGKKPSALFSDLIASNEKRDLIERCTYGIDFSEKSSLAIKSAEMVTQARAEWKNTRFIHAKLYSALRSLIDHGASKEKMKQRVQIERAKWEGLKLIFNCYKNGLQQFYRIPKDEFDRSIIFREAILYEIDEDYLYVKILLAHGVDPNVSYAFKPETPLFFSKSDTMRKLLISHGANRWKGTRKKKLRKWLLFGSKEKLCEKTINSFQDLKKILKR